MKSRDAHSPEPNICVPLRRAYAELLRQFASGRMTNFEYEDRFDELSAAAPPDDAVWAVYLEAWHYYCDIQKHRMTDPDRRLSPSARRRLATWIVFLHTDQPGDVPSTRPASTFALVRWLAACVATVVGCVMQPLTILLLPLKLWILRVMLPSSTTADQPASSEFWPFASVQDFEAARAAPVLLA